MKCENCGLKIITCANTKCIEEFRPGEIIMCMQTGTHWHVKCSQYVLAEVLREAIE